MYYIMIDTRTKDLIRSLASYKYNDSSRKVGPDLWEVLIEEDVFDCLMEVQLEGETVSDTIQRLADPSYRSGKFN